MGYFWSPDPETMRFLLPTFPIYTLVAVYFISQLKKKYQIAFLSIALLVSLPWGVSGSLRAVRPLYVRNSAISNITKTIERDIADGSIIITFEGICQNLDVYDKWKLIDISILSKAGALTGKMPTKPMRNEYASKVYNPLSGNDFKNQFIKDLNQWSAKRIFLIAYRSEIEMVNKLIGDRFNIDKMTSIDISNLPVLKPMFPSRAQRSSQSPRVKQPAGQNRPVRPNQIFDFEIRKEPLIIVELTVK